MIKKQKLLVTGVAAACLLSFSFGAQAASTLEKIQANLNHGIKFVLNGEAWNPKDSNGSAVVPISYKGTTYVPLRSVGEATGAEIGFDGNTQTISISTDSDQKEAVRQAFSEDTVSHIKGISASGITQNKDDLLFGETSYTKAFMVTGVNSAGKDIKFEVKKGKTVGVLIGYKGDGPATYTIGTKTSTFATGTVQPGGVVDNTFDLPAGVTELTLEFTGKAGGNGSGYLIWDESWVE
ncbi:hypothetical protein EBB07_08855 [Paenibacillaceae bacterium]|nr:hypothetical protein EBB07_08855 [Paenibacillaceae bacterium]